MTDEHDDGNGAIDQLYEILDMLEDDVRVLETAKRERVNVHQYAGIYEAVIFLDELGMAGRLGLPSMDLDKFLRSSGTIESTTLSQLTGRLKGLLREAESTIAAIATPSPIVPGQSASKNLGAITAIEWVTNPIQSNATLISDLTALLNEAVSRASGTNLPPSKAALSEFERRALIDLLETAIQMLKGPLIEKGLLKTLGDAAGQGAASAVKKGTEVGLGVLLKRALDLLAELLGSL